MLCSQSPYCTETDVWNKFLFAPCISLLSSSLFFFLQRVTSQITVVGRSHGSKVFLFLSPFFLEGGTVFSQFTIPFPPPVYVVGRTTGRRGGKEERGIIQTKRSECKKNKRGEGEKNTPAEGIFH
ncbi:hypothetical protein, unlikely [Trypanosoma brucei gambiense DAL972]|uniref:Uncharacterized protein n=1 Tax=Trypanosoma brucei gambiense (strain MHOM/CI/86/DAL972) TaxID=679716 RepID=D0A1E4_TRYB9|nr:hypothetical protein, unlikely [Trypanosoma brucei gambiense DAL972]CBH15086.1 hypothetical protein, unlikely [Trypanosoma brucei gambiense DAL972]|eukprot:XP_011777352.1 hypothetical protein, unlikely [Trypanosoma brucei gambiense DAL972]